MAEEIILLIIINKHLLLHVHIYIMTIYMKTCVNHMCNCFAWLLEAVCYGDFTKVMRVLGTELCGKIPVSHRLLRVCNERVCEVSGVSPSRSCQ